MEQRQVMLRFFPGAKRTIAFLLLVVSSGAILTSCNPTTDSAPTTSPTSTAIAPTPEQKPATTKAEIYLVQDKNGKLELVPRSITIEQKLTNPQGILEQTFNRLLAQSDGNEIPKGTKVRSIKVDKDAITVDLSPEFTSGGGSASMTGRLGQVIYTATSLNPKGKVFLSVNGQPLKTLGGEGLEVSQPMTREIFQKDFPL